MFVSSANLATIFIFVVHSCIGCVSDYSLTTELVALKRAVFVCCVQAASELLGARVLGDGLRSLADGVLGELSGQQQADGGLHLAARDRRAAVVVCKTRRLGGDALEDVVDEAVHDRHGLAADAGVWVDLLQHLVDVDRVALSALAVTFLVSSAHSFSLAGGFLRSLAGWFRRHDSASILEMNDNNVTLAFWLLIYSANGVG